MFGLSTFRLCAYGAILLVIAGGYWRYAYVLHQRDAATKEARELVIERDKAKADFLAYRKAKEKDDLLNRTTRDVLQKRLHAIELSRHPVSVRCYAASVPGAAATSGASGGADAAAVNGSPTAPLRDIGGALEDARIEALKNNALHVRLEEWERARR